MNDLTTAKQVFNDYRHAVEEFQQANNQTIEELKKSKAADVVSQQKVDRISDAIDDLQQKYDLLTKKMQRPKITPAQELTLEAKPPFCHSNCGQSDCLLRKNREQYKEYCLAFSNYLRWASDKHGEGLNETNRKALNLGATSDGGYWLPDHMMQNIDQTILELSPIRRYCSSIRISGSHFSYPTGQNDNRARWIGEDASISNVNASSQPDEVTVKVCEHYTMPKISHSALEDSHFNIEEWLTQKIAESFAAGETTSFITGSGNIRPKGIMNYSVLTSTNTNKHVLVEQTKGNIDPAQGKETIENLYKLIYSMESEFRKDAVWAMNRNTLHKIRRLKDQEGNHIWLPSTNPSTDSNLLGYKIVELEDMEDIGANKKPIIFVNFRRALLIVDHSMHMIRDPYSHKPWVLFYVSRKVGSSLMDARALKYLQIPAATSTSVSRG